MTPQVLDKLANLVEADFAVGEHNNIMTRNSDGRYNVFMLFDLRESDRGVTVCRDEQVLEVFRNLRVALSWCIATKYQQTQLADEITRLDLDAARLDSHALVLADVTRRVQDPERRTVMKAKHEDTVSRLRAIQNRLQKCISRAKYLQIRGFNDEIARTRRPTPNRTSRPTHRKSSRKTT